MNEVVPEHLRGGLVDLHAVSLVLGYTIQGWVGYGYVYFPCSNESFYSLTSEL